MSAAFGRLLLCAAVQQPANQAVQTRQRVHKSCTVFVIQLTIVGGVSKKGRDLLRLVAVRERRQQRLDRVSQEDRRRSYTLSATVTTRAGRWRTCAVAGFVIAR